MASYSNPDSGTYDDVAEPSSNKLDQWTVVSAWTVFNKWLDDVPNNENCSFIRHPDMTYYPRSGNNSMGVIPGKWVVEPGILP